MNARDDIVFGTIAIAGSDRRGTIVDKNRSDRNSGKFYIEFHCYCDIAVFFFYPRRIKIDANLTAGFIMSIPSTDEEIFSYTITVKNLGARPVTIKNVYLNFGGKQNGHVFLDNM